VRLGSVLVDYLDPSHEIVQLVLAGRCIRYASVAASMATSGELARPRFVEG
jgi:hypothetical protein